MIQSPGKLLGLSYMFAGTDSYDVGNQIGTDLINVHFKGVWLGDSTPQGKGNDSLYEQRNVKDNNYPCRDD